MKDLFTKGSVVAIASGDPGEDYYLLQVTGQRAEIVKTLAKDDWDAFICCCLLPEAVSTS